MARCVWPKLPTVEKSLAFLLASASTPTPPRVKINIRPSAYTSIIGRLVCAIVDKKTGLVTGGNALGSIKLLQDADHPGVRKIVFCERGVILDRLDEIFALIVDSVLRRVLEVATSDPSATVRLCIVRALDSRYDTFLAQTHHLSRLFLTLQDEALVTRAAGLHLLL